SPRAQVVTGRPSVLHFTRRGKARASARDGPGRDPRTGPADNDTNDARQIGRIRWTRQGETRRTGSIRTFAAGGSDRSRGPFRTREVPARGAKPANPPGLRWHFVSPLTFNLRRRCIYLRPVLRVRYSDHHI